jgi:hypothetical protein
VSTGVLLIAGRVVTNCWAQLEKEDGQAGKTGLESGKGAAIVEDDPKKRAKGERRASAARALIAALPDESLLALISGQHNVPAASGASGELGSPQESPGGSGASAGGGSRGKKKKKKPGMKDKSDNSFKLQLREQVKEKSESDNRAAQQDPFVHREEGTSSSTVMMTIVGGWCGTLTIAGVFISPHTVAWTAEARLGGIRRAKQVSEIFLSLPS